MKKIVFIVLFAAMALAAGAQGIQRTREALERRDGTTGARIEVREEPDAARAILEADRLARVDRVDGFRVSLFRDNKQSSGEDARAVAVQFRDKFPGIPVQVTYESPYFKVTAGNYVDRVDAVALCGKALPHFPKAVVVAEKEIPLADIVNQQKAIAGGVADSLADSLTEPLFEPLTFE